jgi:uncharacterized protein (DUF427 family)
MSKLAKKVALVPGGSRGIGAAIAKRLAADGASVAITYAKDASAASAVVKAIELGGGKSIAIQADAANVEAVKGAVEKAVATFGRLDVLVNLPCNDADMSLLVRTTHYTYCPYKGDCTYYSIPIGGTKSEYAVWTYEKPYEAMASIKEYLAFSPSRVDAIEVVS